MGSGVVWVFHAGALGDFVLIWPMLRALARSGRAVTVVADGSKARLAAEDLGVAGVDSEGRRYTRLWAGECAPEDRVEGVAQVLTFAADPAGDGGRAWFAGARAMFPGALVEHVGPPGSGSRQRVWRELEVERLGEAAARENAGGPIVVHVGAGSREKMWAMERWREVVETLRRKDAGGGGRGVEVIAGEVEAERMTGAERHEFAGMGGVFRGGLGELAAGLRRASLFIGCDTGPTHLAAQLGVRTVALFGPTDPGVWAPRGPRVQVVAPPRPAGMEWLSVPDVLSAARGMGAGNP